jgi:hypothetical protein
MGTVAVDLNAKRLRMIGLLVVGISFVLLWLPMITQERMKYDDAIASTLAIGIGLLLLAEIGPLVRSLKAGGVEVEFGESVTDKFNTLEARVAAIELSARHPEKSRDEMRARAEAQPRALDRPITQQDDLHKGRFGGMAERDGYRLSALFRNLSKNFVEVVLRVEAPEQAGLDQADCVKFYLHDSFDPNIVPAIFHDRVAEFSLIARGGFTVGAWVGCSDIELELDLSKVRGAPRIIREL